MTGPEGHAVRSRPDAGDGPVAARVTVEAGVALHVERRAGDAARPAFVLVHGLASNLRLWDGVAERLQRHVRDGHLAVDTIVYRGEQPSARLLIGVE